MVEIVKCEVSGYGPVQTAERKIPDCNGSVKFYVIQNKAQW
jgi:hypothetical protein